MRFTPYRQLLCALIGSIIVCRSVAIAESTFCAGDCDQSGRVTVDELVRCVAIGLGRENVSVCAAGDDNADGEMTIDEVAHAVGRALEGCGAPVGASCVVRSDCASSACVDGVCCDRECEHGRCDFPQRLGQCTQLSAAGGPCTIDLECLSEVCEEALGICCERDCPGGCRLDGRCLIEGRP